MSHDVYEIAKVVGIDLLTVVALYLALVLRRIARCLQDASQCVRTVNVAPDKPEAPEPIPAPSPPRHWHDEHAPQPPACDKDALRRQILGSAL